MVFKIFTLITFIAELIITIAVIKKLTEIDRQILNTSAFVSEIKPKLKELVSLVKKTSALILAVCDDFVHGMKKRRDEVILEELTKMLFTIWIWKANLKIIKKLKKSRLVKSLKRAFSMLQFVV